jgi:hypothetical protein
MENMPTLKWSKKTYPSFVWDLFNSAVGAPPLTRSRKDSRTGNVPVSHRFSTWCFTLPYFTALLEQWYVLADGKQVKRLPEGLEGMLTPVASIAYWLASDGTYCREQTKTVTIATDSYSVPEVDRLRGILLDKYGINSTRISNGHGKDQYKIRVAKSSMAKLQQLVEPDMPDSMRGQALAISFIVSRLS